MGYERDVVERLGKQSLTFGRDDGSRPYTTRLVLEPDGQVGGYSHSNEVTWRVSEGALELCNAAGIVTTRFDEVVEDTPERLVLRGPCRTVHDRRLDHVISGHGWAPILRDLRQELYCGDDPFSIAQTKYVDMGYPHSSLTAVPEFIDAVLRVVRPGFWLEVGSMVGGSAIITARTARTLGLNTGLVAIDPFCGDVNMWAWEAKLRAEGKWRFLRLEDGMPTIYPRFLANVVEAGLKDSILPITATSIVGMRLLARLHSDGRIAALPDGIYLDSAHELEETYLELKTAWSILPDDGVIVGDDWDWRAIRNDVRRFAAEMPINRAVQQKIADLLPGCEWDDNILLYRRQWVLAR